MLTAAAAWRSCRATMEFADVSVIVHPLHAIAMISFDTGSHRFDLRAAAIIVHDDHLLLHRKPGDEYWALPGGRVEAGEAAADAVVREVFEETGEVVVSKGHAWVVENFFMQGGRRCHEVGLYFVVELAADSSWRDTSHMFAGREENLALEFAWFALDGVDAIDLRPAMIKERLASRDWSLRHLVQHE
jgi:8-oxo-dGTP pyrophosphatase MutT (NUDIX family)